MRVFRSARGSPCGLRSQLHRDERVRVAVQNHFAQRALRQWHQQCHPGQPAVGESIVLLRGKHQPHSATVTITEPVAPQCLRQPFCCVSGEHRSSVQKTTLDALRKPDAATRERPAAPGRARGFWRRCTRIAGKFYSHADASCLRRLRRNPRHKQPRGWAQETNWKPCRARAFAPRIPDLAALDPGYPGAYLSAVWLACSA